MAVYKVEREKKRGFKPIERTGIGLQAGGGMMATVGNEKGSQLPFTPSAVNTCRSQVRNINKRNRSAKILVSDSIVKNVFPESEEADA